MTESPTVYERIAAAYQDIAAMPFVKSGTVNAGTRDSYKFVPISQILQAVREAHARHGVIVLFGRPEYDAEQGEKRYTYEKTSRDGSYTTRWQAANGHIDVRICGGSAEDVIELTVPCEAQDNSDKLTNKLITNAERTLYRTLYAIDEGDEDDPEAVNEPIEKPAPQVSRAEKLRQSSDPFFTTGDRYGRGSQ